MSKTSTSTINPPLNPSLSSNFTPKISLNLHPLPFHSKPTKKFHLKLHASQSPDAPNSPKTPNLFSFIRSLPEWADEVQEKGMRKKRFLYTHENWAEHRSSLRHFRHLMSSSSSRVILSLIPPVLFFTSVAVFICGYNTVVTLDLLPECFPVLRSSSLPYQLTAPALALLLVFRTEASYSRFEDGRKAWTKVIAGTTDLARQVIAGVNDFNDGCVKKSLLQYTMAFPISLKCHLLDDSDVRGDLQNILDADDLAIVLSSKHRPHCIIQFISQSIRSLNLKESEMSHLESKLSSFHEGISVCEELIGIPIPLSYTRLTSRFLVLWHLTLPITLWDDCHWIVVPATFVSAASLFCIEEVGVLIEEPFPMLALDELCKVVCSNIQETIAIGKTIRARKWRTHDINHSSNDKPVSSV